MTKNSFFKQHPSITKFVCITAVSLVAFFLLLLIIAVLTFSLWTTFNISFISFEWMKADHPLLQAMGQDAMNNIANDLKKGTVGQLPSQSLTFSSML